MSFFDEQDLKKATDSISEKASSEERRAEEEREIKAAMTYALDCFVSGFKELPELAAKVNCPNKLLKVVNCSDKWLREEFRSIAKHYSVKDKSKSSFFKTEYKKEIYRTTYTLSTYGVITKRDSRNGERAPSSVNEFYSDMLDVIQEHRTWYKSVSNVNPLFFWARFGCEGRILNDDSYAIFGPRSRDEIEKQIKEYFIDSTTR